MAWWRGSGREEDFGSGSGLRPCEFDDSPLTVIDGMAGADIDIDGASGRFIVGTGGLESGRLIVGILGLESGKFIVGTIGAEFGSLIVGIGRV